MCWLWKIRYQNYYVSHLVSRFCVSWITQALLYKTFKLFIFIFCNFIFRNFVLNWYTLGSFPRIQNLTNFGEVFGWDLVKASSIAQNKKLNLSSYSVKKRVEITKVDKNAQLITLKWDWIQTYLTASDTSASKVCWLRLDDSPFFLQNLLTDSTENPRTPEYSSVKISLIS